MKKITILLFLILSICSYCKTDRALYVNTQTGNDKFPETFNRPLKTIPEVNERLRNNPADLDNRGGNGILAGVSDSVIIDHCTATNNGWDMPGQGNGPVESGQLISGKNTGSKFV